MIKVKVLAWIEDDGQLFVLRGHDSVKGDDYYRPVGGSIQFGEKSSEALHREMKEELQAEISILGEPLILENIFTCDGAAGHEIDILYPARFSTTAFDKHQVFRLVEESGEVYEALWVSLEDCLNGSLRLVPEELLDWYRARC